MEALTIVLLAILLGNQIYLERKVAGFGKEIIHIKECLQKSKKGGVEE